MSFILEKPYTEKEKVDFIVQHNHTEGLEIVETSKALYALQPWEKLENDVVIDDTKAYEEDKAKERENEFNTKFFNTSLGYVKRKVTMKDGSIKDFLSDILPILQVDVPIITYNMPDFTKEDLPTQNLNVKVTTQFIDECKQQVLADFYGA